MRPDVYSDLVFERAWTATGIRPLLLDLHLPRDADEPLPVIVWIHGGGWRSGDKDDGTLHWIVPHGFALASIQYRFSFEAPFPAPLEDCKAAVRWLRARADDYGLDPLRIGVAGASAGGHLAGLVGLTADRPGLEGDGPYPSRSSDVAAVCSYFGPTDFVAMLDYANGIKYGDATAPESQLVGGPIEEHLEAARAASPITYVRPDAPPFLLAHGSADVLVPLDQSERLHAALREHGVDSELFILKHRGHGGPAFNEDSALRETVLAFFRRHLAEASTSTNVDLAGSVQ